MNRIAFIIPYFGKFNNYFPIFLKSCDYNKNLCDWIIITDDRTPYEYPENVKITYISWEQFKEYVEHKFDFSIKLQKPYKLCDFKPAYGYLFEEKLKGYTHWGHCDCDLIWGRISDYLSDEILKSYRKIFNLGHCTIFQNNYETNRLFMRDLEGSSRYKEVYSSKKNFSFDEEYRKSINNICDELGVKVFTDTFAANTYTKSSNFKLTYLNNAKDGYITEKKREAFFVWENGKIKRYEKEGKDMVVEEYMYIHFQSRSMKIRFPVDKIPMVFKMIPNSFDYLEVSSVNEQTFNQVKKKYFNLHYFRLRTKNLIDKIKKKVLQ